MALTAPTGEWTDEQKMLRKSLDQHFEALNAGHLEDDAANRFNRDKWQLIRDSGVLRIPFDSEFGGLGHDVTTLVYTLEHLGYGCRDNGLLFAAATQVVSAAVPLHKFGSDELKERYLSRLIDGEIISAHAISEPNAGSDAMAMITTATEDGDEYILDGQKIWITNVPIADVVTIGANQYVAGKIVDMKIGLENSRKHLYDTARRFARGRSVTTEISMAKLITSEANVASALSAIQIFGARGYSREYGLEKGLRDSVGAPIYSGTNETQRVRIASMLGL